MTEDEKQKLQTFENNYKKNVNAYNKYNELLIGNHILLLI